ncbi:MAG: TasA family protein [Chloroflexota bacterium]|nr:TasA family protein [Chloroflexota bacterium]
MKKVLFSVLLICLVAAMVGAGTWAYFSDYEHSNDNYFAGGTLDLKVNGFDDPNVATFFEVECVAPCDEATVEIDLCNTGCVDGEADLHLTMTENDDNGIAEPESDVDTTDGPGNGELCENLMMRISVDLDDNGSYETQIAEGAFTDIECINWILGDLDAYSCIGLEIFWWVPCEVGNEIMTDICGFDIEFSLNQKQAAYAYYDLTVVSDGCCPITVVGQGAVAAGATETFADIREGTTVVVEADDSDPCCEFVSWSDAGGKSHGVLMDGNKTVTAVCATASYDLTVDQSQSCCSVDVGAPVNHTVAAYSSDTFSVPCEAGSPAVVTLDAVSSGGCTFNGWIGDTADDNQSTSVTMDADKTVTADCTSETYALTVVSSGCCPISVSGAATGSVAAGESETFPGLEFNDVLNVAADDGDACCQFDSWSDAGAKAHDITITGTSTVTAFCSILQSDLTVDQTQSCCDVTVGAPVNQTVAAGTSATFQDITCCTTVTFTADDSDECCDFVSWSGVDSSTNGSAQVHMDGTDKTVSANCNLKPAADLTVNSCGCCPVDVSIDGGAPVTVLAGATQVFTDLPCCTNVSITPQTPEMCICDGVEVDEPYCACDGLDPASCAGVSVHMDGQDHSVNVCCHEMTAPVPEPCCWCIYDVFWWKSPKTPADPPDSNDRYAMHTVEWLPEGHPEVVGDFTIVLPDPTFRQVTSFYDSNWAPNEPVRYNPMLSTIKVTGAQFYNSQTTMLNWKTIYNVTTVLGPLTLYLWTLGVMPVSGNAGWPYAVGNSWISVATSTISTPSSSYYMCTALESITVPLGTLDAYRVEGYAWVDADGVDDDGDGATDEDPLNFYDDDNDGSVDEDGGNGIPEPAELTPSSTTWYRNDYGCYLRQWNYPGALFNGFEYRDMMWYCFDPPFPPWE